MATTTTDSDVVSTPSWIFKRLLQFVVTYPLLIGVVALFSSPAIALGTIYIESAIPFMWFGVAVFAMMVFEGLDREETADYGTVYQNMEEADTREMIAGIIALLCMASGIVTSVIGAVGLLGVLVTTYASLGAVVIFVIGVIPLADSWIARKTGVSVGILGLYLGFAVVWLPITVNGLDMEAIRELRSVIGVSFGLARAQGSSIGI
jgi:hypothetical protein